MKRFVKLLIMGLCIVPLFTQCAEVEKAYLTTYIYNNTTDNPIDITIKFYNNKPQEVFHIEAQRDLIIEIPTRGDFSSPFANHSLNISELIIEWNGIQVRENCYMLNTLLKKEAYTILPSKEIWIRNYEFTFTDDFFKNGTPVTPAE